jgi:hypothetical protein
MKSLNNFDEYPAGIPLVADDVLEFHAARLLLLLAICGINGRIDGLTKMAKLDFFVRYPQFFEKASAIEGKSQQPETPSGAVESSMVRFHYGPWDQRYYHILAFLEARGLLEVTKADNTYNLVLSTTGKEVSDLFLQEPAYEQLISLMRKVKAVFGGRSGSALKKLVYKVFDTEVAKRPLGEVIQYDY